MSAITNINNTMSSAVLLPTRGRLQQVQNPERQIARIDKEIEVKEDYVKTLDNHVNLLKEQKQALVENRDAHIKLRDAHIEMYDLLLESRDLDRKRIALLEKQIDTMKETKDIYLDTNKKLQNVLDDRNNKLRSLFNQGSGRSKSAEPVLNTKTSELNKLDEDRTVLAKKESVLKEHSKAKDVLLEKQTMKLEHIEKQAARLESKVKSADINISKVNTSTNSNKQDISQSPVTYKPSVVTQVKTYSNDELVPNTKTSLTVKALHQQVKASQQNIYDSIIRKNIASNLKLSKLL